ncbi:hypothetical protein BDAP_000851 [Binucleata daphniae]
MSSLSSNKIIDVDNPPSDTPTSISFSQHDLFSVTSWDNSVRFYNYGSNPYTLKHSLSHTSPLLSSCFVNNLVVAGGLDGSILTVDIQTGTSKTFKLHESCIRHCVAINENIYVTGSWDKTIKFTDIRTGQLCAKKDLPERVYGLDYKNNTLCVVTAKNNIITYDVANNLLEKQHTTKLNYTLKSVCLVDDGFVVGGIEGKGEFISTTVSTKRYTFRCHRTTSELFAVNDIAAHPKNDSCFMTCGSDGAIIMYDKSIRQKMMSESFKVPVTCGKFSPDGSVFVAGVGYDWSRGYEQTSDKPGVKVLLMSSTGIKF